MREILRLFQRKIKATFIMNDWSYWEPLEIAAQLFSETGEVSDAVLIFCGPKKIRPGKDEYDVEAEIGDVLLALACFANSKEYNLVNAFDVGIYGEEDKYQSRSALSIVAQLGQRVGAMLEEIDFQYGGDEASEFLPRDYGCMEQRIGNILRILECLCLRIGCSFEGAMKKVLVKLKGRDKYRFPDGK